MVVSGKPMAATLSKVERQAIADKLRAAQIELLLVDQNKPLSTASLRSVIARLEIIIAQLAPPEPK
jgi:hypothetical protein